MTFKHLGLVGVLLTACGQADANQPQQLPVKPLEIHTSDGVQRLSVEVADDEKEREVGLMFRKSMPDDVGMLFMWPDIAMRSFWMRNTYIPLDLIYIQRGKIVRIIPWAKPFDETSLPSGEPVDVVLEVNGGWTARRGVSVGHTVKY